MENVWQIVYLCLSSCSVAGWLILGIAKLLSKIKAKKADGKLTAQELVEAVVETLREITKYFIDSKTSASDEVQTSEHEKTETKKVTVNIEKENNKNEG